MDYKEFIREKLVRKNSRMIGTYYLMLLGLLPVVFTLVFYLIISYSTMYNNKIDLMELEYTGSTNQKGIKDNINVFIYPKDEKIIVNIQGYIISWNKDQESLDLEKLNKEFKKEIDRRLLLSFLRKKQMNNLTVSIYPGEGLRYLDVVPLIQSMSNIGITNYSFKGKNQKSNKNI